MHSPLGRVFVSHYCLTRYWFYPENSQQLTNCIEDKHRARTTRANLINISQDMMKYNSKCKIFGVIH